MYRRITLVNYDPQTDLLEMEEEYELVINSHSRSTVVPYDFKLEGNWPPTLTNFPYIVSSLVINEADCSKSVRYIGTRGKSLIVKHGIKLQGEECYNVRRNMRRVHNIGADPVFHMIATRFTESMVVSVDNRVAQNISVKAIAIGIAKKGITIASQEPQLLRCEVKQLMLPGDGLLLVFEKV
jgi:hypothetical protein